MFVGLLLTPTCAGSLLVPLGDPAASHCQSAEQREPSLSPHSPLDTCPAWEPFLHWDSSCSLTSLLVQAQCLSVCRASAMLGADTWEQPGFFSCREFTA